MSATAVAFIPLRVVTPGLPLGLAPSGRVACQLPLVFPNKFVAENLDYTVDFSFAAGAAAVPGAALGGFSVTAVPVGPAALVISQQSVSELQALFYLGGGVAGMQYVVTVTATLPNGKVMQAIVILQVLANPAPLNPACTPAPAMDIDSAAGQIITDGIGNPITSA